MSMRRLAMTPEERKSSPPTPPPTQATAIEKIR
jgi:hypothetical protein